MNVIIYSVCTSTILFFYLWNHRQKGVSETQVSCCVINYFYFAFLVIICVWDWNRLQCEDKQMGRTKCILSTTADSWILHNILLSVCIGKITWRRFLATLCNQGGTKRLIKRQERTWATQSVVQTELSVSLSVLLASNKTCWLCVSFVLLLQVF